MSRNALYPENPVAEAVRRCGGLSRVAQVTGASRTTIWRWRKAGRINKLDAAVALAKEIEWPIERLVRKVGAAK